MIELCFVILDLPKPNLGDLSELKTMRIKLKREKNPNVLGFSYRELAELDKVEVELEPDKKGLILKHREYTVSSRVSIIIMNTAWCVVSTLVAKLVS